MRRFGVLLVVIGLVLLCGCGGSEFLTTPTLSNLNTGSVLVRVDWATGTKAPQESQVRSIKIQVIDSIDSQLVITRPITESALKNIPIGKHVLEISVYSSKDGSGIPLTTVSQGVTIRTGKTELLCMTIQHTVDRVILSLRLLIIKDGYRSFTHQ
jgi:hypothetical protein